MNPIPVDQVMLLDELGLRLVQFIRQITKLPECVSVSEYAPRLSPAAPARCQECIDRFNDRQRVFDSVFRAAVQAEHTRRGCDSRSTDFPLPSSVFIDLDPRFLGQEFMASLAQFLDAHSSAAHRHDVMQALYFNFAIISDWSEASREL
jgi:hypothetical protein